MSAAPPDLFGTPPAAHDPGGKIRVRWPADSKVTAVFSPCDRYRYELREIWDRSKPIWLWLLMNPSVAGLAFSDMAVQKTGKISRLGGAGGQIIANTGAYRSTDPIGPENEATIIRLAHQCSTIIVAYGQPPKSLAGVGLRLARMLHDRGADLRVLRLAQDGTPMHPLSRGKGFIPVDTVPQFWVPGQ